MPETVDDLQRYIRTEQNPLVISLAREILDDRHMMRALDGEITRRNDRIVELEAALASSTARNLRALQTIQEDRAPSVVELDTLRARISEAQEWITEHCRTPGRDSGFLCLECDLPFPQHTTDCMVPRILADG